MKGRLGAAFATGGAALLLLLGSVPAAAGEGEPTVTLSASPSKVTYGETTTLSGAITPAVAGETVSIVDTGDGAVLATAVTGADGAYALAHAPERNVEVRAEWGEAASDPATIRVRPILTAKIAKVLLFGRGVVAGRVRPAHPGAAVTVTLLRNGRRVAERQAVLDAGGRYAARFPIGKPGRYRARVRFAHDDHLPARRRTGVRETPLPALSRGSVGVHVRLLERRLRRLDYRILGVDRRFDHRTGDAVLAFHKVQGMPRTRSVSAATWRRLASPFRPAPRATKPAFHIEIDQARQVLYVVRKGTIDEIVHTSTGRNNWTRDGVFRVHRKIAGYSPGRLYYPSYFDGLRAVHGWPEVPTYPASHGCARVPNWTAVWLHDIMPMGTVVRVYR